MSYYRCRMPYCTGETTQARGVCDDCYFVRADHLRLLPEMYAGAYAHLGPGRRHADAEAIRLPSPSAAIPLHLPAYDAMLYAATVVDAWALLARTRRRAVTPKTWSGAAFVANVNVLRRDDRRVVGSYLVGDYVHDIFCAYHRLTMIAAGYDAKRLRVPCPECDSDSVLARNAGEYAACLTCGARFSHARLATLEHNLRVVS